MLEPAELLDVVDLPTGGPLPPGAPDIVAERAPLPYCGAVLGFPNAGENPFPWIELSEGADDCYRNRAEAGLPAEMIDIGFTIEGDPILAIRRSLSDGREETFSDFTRDGLGSRSWFRFLCPRYRPPGSQDEGCEGSERLVSPDPVPAASTLFDITSAPSESGPPFYVMADRLVAGGADAWGIHQLTIVSEWRTPIAVAGPPARYILDSRGFSRPAAGDATQAEPVIIAAGASTMLQIALEPRLTGEPAPGLYRLEIPIAYWRDVDPTEGPTGPEENTLTLIVTYEILDARAASAISTFCGVAISAAPHLAQIDRQRLSSGLDAVENAAETLHRPEGDDLVAAIAALRRTIDEWFSPQPTHGGFDTSAVIQLVNHLCTTNLPAISIQA